MLSKKLRTIQRNKAKQRTTGTPPKPLKPLNYFAKKRWPSLPDADKIFTEYLLTTPSKTLAEIYNPINYMGGSLDEIKKELKVKIKEKLNEIEDTYDVPKSGSPNSDWYWLALLLFDGEEWAISKKEMPSDLAEVLCDMAIASPAICALRVFKDKGLAETFAKAVATMLDKPEAVAVIKNAYEDKKNPHYKNVLKYCVDGNFAAMLDEYVHIVNDSNPKSLCKKMCTALDVHTTSYYMDTPTSFRKDDANKNETDQSDDPKKMRMRSHFAVGFHSEGDQRKEDLMAAFNSPFRPFVLATTSIGQEGLDFHQYARKIMHWNLPHNPIDIEQREGRINRYKCLAIRQSLAERYGKIGGFKKDVWEELFKRALKDKKKGQPDLIPYWCLPDGDDEKNVNIERIVPMYPYSRDQAVYNRLLEILSLYRLTLGQLGQEELIEHFEQLSDFDKNKLKDLCINLSPWKKPKTE